MISALLLIKGVDTTLISITFEGMYPSYFIEKDNFIYSYETSYQIGVQKKALQYLKKEYNISYMTVIYLKESENDLAVIKKPYQGTA